MYNKKEKNRKNDYRKARAQKFAIRQASMMSEEQFDNLVKELLGK
jgi:hypothetical protein